MEKFIIKVNKIDYCIEDEDVLDIYDINEDDFKCFDDYINEINLKGVEIEHSLPQTMEFVVDCEREDLDDVVCDYITEHTGWLINSFNYDIIN